MMKKIAIFLTVLLFILENTASAQFYDQIRLSGSGNPLSPCETRPERSWFAGNLPIKALEQRAES